VRSLARGPTRSRGSGSSVRRRASRP
jgi:hypothetical protein